MSLPIVYHKDYVVELPPGHRFPMKKFSMLYELLLKDNVIKTEQVYSPQIIPDDIINSIHDKVYVDSYKNGSLSKSEIRKIGLPWSSELVNRTLTAVGGSLLTAELALTNGIACNTAGGTHHAFKNYGSGFCIFNDISVTAQTVLRKGLANKILIIDLDVHQGDGTASMLNDEKRAFTFSMHCKNNFPFIKQNSDFDLSVKEDLSDEEYLKLLQNNIPDLIAEVDPDLIIYDAGVDVYKNDPLGKLSLSLNGIFKRDKFVISESVKRGIAVSCIIGGGYSKNLNELAYRHSLLHRAASDVYNEFGL